MVHSSCLFLCSVHSILHHAVSTFTKITTPVTILVSCWLVCITLCCAGYILIFLHTVYIIFKKKSEELTQTLDGDTCQYWGSNKTHYEGSLLEFWKKPTSLPQEPTLFENLNKEQREAAKDGLMTFVKDGIEEGKFKSHNK